MECLTRATALAVAAVCVLSGRPAAAEEAPAAEEAAPEAATEEKNEA